jgi:nucleoid-associated protein EbfC
MKAALGQIMRQAQAMQENMKRVQDEIARMEVTGESGAGLVRVTLTGRYQARKVQISPEALGEDREFLEDLVEAATRDKMAAVTGGMQLPPGMNFGL